MKLGSMVKVFASFEERFWPEESRYLNLGSDKVGSLQSWMAVGDDKTLVSLMYGQVGKRFEDLSEN